MTTLSELLRVSTPIEFKRAPKEPEGTVAGYASTFGGEPDSYGDVIAPGAFRSSLARHTADGTAPLMLWGHDPDRPVGRWTEFAEDARGLKVRGAFNLNTAGGSDAYAHVKAGDLSGLSIGYRVLPGGSKPGPNGTQILTDLDLLEASIVGLPANRAARVTDVKSFSSKAELLTKLRQVLPSRAASKALPAVWAAIVGEDDDQPDPEINEGLLKALGSLTTTLERSIATYRKI